MTNLTGGHALVTGASRGIGAAIALALAEHGADVAITFQNSPDRAQEVVTTIEKLGRKDLSPNDLARIMTETLRRPVVCREIGIEDFRASLLARGASPAIAEGYADMMAAKRDGLDNAVARTPENTTPTSFQEWCEDVLKPAVEAR